MIRNTTLLNFFTGLLLIVLFQLQVSAQELGSLKGNILINDNSAAAGASIQLKETSQAVLADAEGNFTFSGLKQGTYTLVARMLGYVTHTQKVELTEGQELSLRVVLTVDSQQLQTVEVIGRKNTGYKSDYSFAATKTAIPVTEIPSTVSTITQQMIIDRQAVRFDDVARSTNVRITNNGRSVVIRGFVSTTRLINGLRTLNENYRFPSISPVVENYEVVKGPSSSMFGNMSPGGVVNLVTKNHLPRKNKRYHSVLVVLIRFVETLTLPEK